MTARRRVLAAAILLAALSTFPAAAEKAPRRLIVAMEAKGGDGYTATELLQLSRSLMSAILASGTQVLLLDWGSDPFPSEKPEGIEEAVKRTADCWLLVTIGGGRKSPALAIRSYDVLLKQNVIEGKLQMNAGFEFPDPPAATWAKLVGMVAGAYPPLDTDQPLQTAATGRPALWTKDLATLTLHAVPGTVVEGLDGEPRTVGADGILKESVRSPATYLLTATHPGQLPLESRIYLEDDRDLTLPQHALARWSVDGGLYGFSFPQVEGSYFIVPAWLYVRVGFMTYLAGLAFGEESMFWSSPLTTLSARFGTYAFFPQESWFRTYVGGGVFLRVAHPFGSPPVYIDPAAPWGFQLTLGIEVSPWPQSRFFFEWLPTEYLTPFPDLFTGSMPWVPPSMIVLPYGVLDMGGFRLGWRMML
ncbi:MAG: hypothetical protein A2177_15555 [Spirochaetes bacterium RBG_13_68_11]|nr:MAG: hypothetical protein A2177_15555 [Spirochaetes bacterium RBG_13_68_11]